MSGAAGCLDLPAHRSLVRDNHFELSRLTHDRAAETRLDPAEGTGADLAISSSTLPATTMVARGRSRLIESRAVSMTASDALVSQAPRPYNLSPSPTGSNGLRDQPEAGTVSRCATNNSVSSLVLELTPARCGDRRRHPANGNRYPARGNIPKCRRRWRNYPPPFGSSDGLTLSKSDQSFQQRSC